MIYPWLSGKIIPCNWHLQNTRQHALIYTTRLGFNLIPYHISVPNHTATVQLYPNDSSLFWRPNKATNEKNMGF